jgi:threonylcarbamoyladenosine tRNA methylthiotransferase MtaB
MKVAAYTLGCKVNQYDTNAMVELLVAAGFEQVNFHEKADVYLINTCTVTNVADKKSRNIIRRIHHLHPNALICVCGCLAQRERETILGMEGVSAVIGTKERSKIVQTVQAAMEGRQQNDGDFALRPNEQYEELSVRTSGELTRGYLKIQEGCNCFCSYCIIPYVRGRIRSRSLQSVRKEALGLVANGVLEVVLTGIHISSYGVDTGESLIDLLGALETIEGLKRIRIGSLEPHILTEEFLERISQFKKICPHFHVSLQSGSDTVLKRMNRKYTADEYRRNIHTIRDFYDRPAVTTDVIAGFPGETEYEWKETMDFVREIGFSRIHAFPYSQREGTPAARMKEQIPVHVRKERANELIIAGKKLEEQYARQFLNERRCVLFEQLEDGLAEGYTERYLRVRAKADLKKISMVLLKELKDGIIYGEVIK